MQNSTGVKSRELELVELLPEMVPGFVENLSPENVREFKEVYQSDPGSELLLMAENRNQKSYAVVQGDKVLAVTGIVDMRGEGLIWALFSKDLRRSFVRFARASMTLMDFYHKDYSTLVCDIWVENDMIAQWLSFLDFEPELEFTHNNKPMMRFVRYCTNDEHKIPFAQRPVLH